jgi:hypothetical protein
MTHLSCFDIPDYSGFTIVCTANNFTTRPLPLFLSWWAARISRHTPHWTHAAGGSPFDLENRFGNFHDMRTEAANKSRAGATLNLKCPGTPVFINRANTRMEITAIHHGLKIMGNRKKIRMNANKRQPDGLLSLPSTSIPYAALSALRCS